MQQQQCHLNRVFFTLQQFQLVLIDRRSSLHAMPYVEPRLDSCHLNNSYDESFSVIVPLDVSDDTIALVASKALTIHFVALSTSYFSQIFTSCFLS